MKMKKTILLTSIITLDIKNRICSSVQTPDSHTTYLFPYCVKCTALVIRSAKVVMFHVNLHNTLRTSLRVYEIYENLSVLIYSYKSYINTSGNCKNEKLWQHDA